MTDILTSLISILPLAVLIAFPVVLVRLLDTTGAPDPFGPVRAWEPAPAVAADEADRLTPPARSAERGARHARRVDRAPAPARLNS